MVPTLRLGRGLSAGQKPVNDHFLLVHHSCVLAGLGYVGEGVKHFNGLVDFATLRYMLSRFVSHQCKVRCCSISGA